MMRTIWQNRQGEIRAGWRLLAYLGLTALLVLPVLKLASYWSGGKEAGGADTLFAAEALLLYAALCAAVLLPALLMFRKVDKRPFAWVGFGLHKRVGMEIFQGLVQGFFLVTLIFLAGWSAGWIEASISEGIGSAAIWQTGFYFAFFALAAAFEELLWRGYAFQVLIQGIGKTAAVAISAGLFGAAHLANPHADALGTINTMLAGIWLSAAYLRTRSLWLPTCLHAAWNCSQGFVYGFPVSGVVCPETILRLSMQGSSWMTGGDYGPEGGALGTLILSAATAYLIQSGSVKSAPGVYALWHPPSAPAAASEAPLSPVAGDR